MNLNFYDNLGYQYTAKFAIKSTGTDGKYTVELTSVLDSNNQNITANLSKQDMAQIFGKYNADAKLGEYVLTKDYKYDSASNSYINKTTGEKFLINKATDNSTTFVGENGSKVSITEIFSGITTTIANNIKNGTNNYKVKLDTTTGQATVTGEQTSYDLEFDTSSGKFKSIGGENPSVMLNMGALSSGLINNNRNFQNITVDFSQCLNYENGGKSTIGADAGATDGKTGKGRKLGAMTGIFIDTSGRIYGTYDNGNTELLGQIAVAQFSNASGLEKVGESCYRTTLNSGEFDGIGVEISADGSSMTTGELEMSNVDLSSEFTSMITTQRGFQANSRVITTSDTLLEELVNLKR